jgi:TatD DNase family protein
MLIDTHCHINIMVKNSFDTPLTPELFPRAQTIIEEAQAAGISLILNVGTSVQESFNCIELARAFAPVYASIGIHPNDLTTTWKDDLKTLSGFLQNKKELKIVAIGECGLDFHYPDYNKEQQKDAFKKQIELSLEHNLALVVHTRDAGEETLHCLQEFKDSALRGVIHCFSEDLSFAQEAINLGFVLGIGGTITYPKNTILRQVITTVGLDHIILETDAPFLPPQHMRGKQNHPRFIKSIAEYIANLLQTPVDRVSTRTTHNAVSLFRFSESSPYDH